MKNKYPNSLKKLHNYNFLYLIVITTIFMISCSSKTSEKSEVDALYDEVIEIHDEVMPKMSEIVSLRKQAKEELNQEMAKSAPDQERVAILEDRIAELDAADDAMMNWMRNFQANLDDLTEEEQIKYLTEEKKKVSEVRDQMLEVIQE